MHPSGYYAWRRNAHSQRHHDLRALGESCSRHRVARLMRSCGWRAQVGHRRRSGFYGGAPHNLAANILDRQFDVAQPNMAWVTDITYIRAYEGWLYLAVVDLFSRQVGWSMDSRMSKELVLQALLAAVWRCKPKQSVMLHSDQGGQFTSYEWAAFLAAHNLQPSMSRRGNCHDNAVAESFFQLLKRERIKRKIYRTRDLVRQDIFDYIEMFYNPIRRHSHAPNLSPVNYERQYFSEATSCL